MASGLRCTSCQRRPDQIPEYIEGAANSGLTPDDYVRQEEGTFNSSKGLFACTSCYVAMGMPSTPRGVEGIMIIEPEVGRRYVVILEDCCIEGSFTATVTKVDREAKDDDPWDGWGGHVEFDNGVILNTFGAVTLEAVPS